MTKNNRAMRRKNVEFAKKVGRNLRELRDRAGYPSRWAAAEAAGIKEPALYTYEQGMCTPSLDIAVDLCKALECKLDDLIKE